MITVHVPANIAPLNVVRTFLPTGSSALFSALNAIDRTVATVPHGIVGYIIGDWYAQDPDPGVNDDVIVVFDSV